ncbi:MAG: acyl-CoA dehydrogenase family protein [Dehalococcoidia bacterium]|nr:MAG: acyl-CoA dehydrogenase family protein [Dehalococcoidia bacterium]
MDFLLTEDQKMLRTMVREFAEKELEPIAAQIDEEARFPAESIKKMAELGLMGIPFPEKYGGSGGGPIEVAMFVTTKAINDVGIDELYEIIDKRRKNH